jgi:hypothetical protein
MHVRRSRLLRPVVALAGAAVLALGPTSAAAALPSPSSLMTLASVPLTVSGYEVGASSQGLLFSGGAMPGAGTWSATVQMAPLSPTAPLPATLQLSGGTLTLSALGQTFTLSLPPTGLTLSSAATGAATAGQVGGTPACPSAGSGTNGTGTSGTSAAPSSTASTTTAAPATTSTGSGATGCSGLSPSAALVPVGLGPAEEMLQVWSGAGRAAAGDSTAHPGIAAWAARLEAAAPSLAALGSFPLPSADVIAPPRVLTPDWGNGCGDSAYGFSMKLSLGRIASGNLDGQFIVYRVPTAAGCASYATAMSGRLIITSLFGQAP